MSDCLYPGFAASTAYKKGCRCERCRSARNVCKRAYRLAERGAVVYAHVDPFTTALRYVGKTTMRLSERTGRHLDDARSGRPERHKVWLRELGRRPLVIELERPDPDLLDEREAYWATGLLKGGADLLNTYLPCDPLAPPIDPSSVVRERFGATT